MSSDMSQEEYSYNQKSAGRKDHRPGFRNDKLYYKGERHDIHGPDTYINQIDLIYHWFVVRYINLKEYANVRLPFKCPEFLW
jgi:hypothetical protein